LLAFSLLHTCPEGQMVSDINSDRSKRFLQANVGIKGRGSELACFRASSLIAFLITGPICDRILLISRLQKVFFCYLKEKKFVHFCVNWLEFLKLVLMKKVFFASKLAITCYQILIIWPILLPVLNPFVAHTVPFGFN
jgi:hypothetical protein